MNYPIPSHIKEFFQLADANNGEYKVKWKLKCSCDTESFNVYHGWNTRRCNIIVFDKLR